MPSCTLITDKRNPSSHHTISPSYIFAKIPAIIIMQLHQKIVLARKSKGLTQEDLATGTNVTVRTIQRIESGESSPRPYTLKAIAKELAIPFEELAACNSSNNAAAPAQSLTGTAADEKHFLQLHCLACFSFLVIPFVHFLVPAWLLKRSGAQPAAVTTFARKTIQTQVYWQIALQLLMLTTVAYNFTRAAYFEKTFRLHYLWPLFFMFIVNTIIIAVRTVQVRRLYNQ